MKTADSAVYLFTQNYTQTVWVNSATAPGVCVHLDGLNAENTFHCWLYSV